MHREKRNIHKILRTFAGVDDGMHLHCRNILLCGDPEAILLNCLFQPREWMVYNIYLHALNKADKRILFYDGGNKPVLVNQHPLHSHSIQGGDTEKIQIIAHTMTNLEAQRRSTNKTCTTKQWLRLKAT